MILTCYSASTKFIIDLGMLTSASCVSSSWMTSGGKRASSLIVMNFEIGNNSLFSSLPANGVALVDSASSLVSKFSSWVSCYSLWLMFSSISPS